MSAKANKKILEVSNLSKTYVDNDIQNEVLKNINLTLKSRESLGIVGQSGSGKSTLLHLLGGLDTATEGEIVWFGNDLSYLNDRQVSAFRNNSMGFVYQFHHLVAEFTVLENVLLPIKISGVIKKQKLELARTLLSELGLANLESRKITDISGGERQRVAIARAMINSPKVILADEPTGNLDAENSMTVIKKLTELQKKYETSLIIVTHDIQISDILDKCLVLSDGKLKKK